MIGPRMGTIAPDDHPYLHRERVLPSQMLGDLLHGHTRLAHLPDRPLVFLREPDHHTS
jgi:hypothetical protein